MFSTLYRFLDIVIYWSKITNFRL